MTSWGHDTLAQTHAHMTSICSSVSGSKTLPTLLKFSRFSGQISGFSADFHRKLLDIVKQHPNNAEIWADSVFKPSNQGQMGERKFDEYRFSKNWKLENGKKIRVLAIQKVTKTGNIGKNSSGRQYQLCKIHHHAEVSVTMREMTQG